MEEPADHTFDLMAIDQDDKERCDGCSAEAVHNENGTKLCESCFQEYVVKHK